jgi:hypothetical protein
MRRSVLLGVLVAGLAATGCTAAGGGGAGAPRLSPTTVEPAVAVAAAAPAFHWRIHPIGPRTKARMARSWRPGCPVGLGDLRRLEVDHWGFDGRVHRGELVVHRHYARRILAVAHKLFKARYKIQRMRLVDAYGADDDRSMAANNTSAYNCRFVSGTRRWSEHARGRAIDLNPLINPYVTRGGRVSPPAGRPYANRAVRAPGMIHDGGLVVRAFAAAGWRWGGHWRGAKDYQHFSATGQ